MSNTNYQENPQLQDFPDFDHVFDRFKNTGNLKSENQIRAYKAISKHWSVGKAVLDAGCGIGIGSNILSWDAIGVWGVDNNAQNISVARQLFERPTVKFEVVDLVQGPERPVATFDVVVAIEIIEHIKEYDNFLQQLKRFYEPKRRTVFFISSPNRNNPELSKDKPKNEHHVREWTAGEFYDVLTKRFGAVVLYDMNKVDNFTKDETVDGDTEVTPILAKVENPL